MLGGKWQSNAKNKNITKWNKIKCLRTSNKHTNNNKHKHRRQGKHKSMRWSTYFSEIDTVNVCFNLFSVFSLQNQFSTEFYSLFWSSLWLIYLACFIAIVFFTSPCFILVILPFSRLYSVCLAFVSIFFVLVCSSQLLNWLMLNWCLLLIDCSLTFTVCLFMTDVCAQLAVKSKHRK